MTHTLTRSWNSSKAERASGQQQRPGKLCGRFARLPRTNSCHQQLNLPNGWYVCIQMAHRMWVSEDFEQQFLELEQRLSGCIIDLSAALHIKT